MQKPRYGVDVAARRFDALDKQLIAAIAAGVAQGNRPSVLELGCGSGVLAAHVTNMGARVSAVDISESATVPAIYHFVKGDMRDEVARLREDFDYAVLQRVIHYLPYADARALLRKLKKHAAGLYISVTGLESAIGAVYPGAELPLTARFVHLNAPDQETFSIGAPVCLYSADEFCALITSAGWTIEQQRTSAFGNHQIYATA
jgi:SAM-dependent methyltransferase